MFCSLEQIELRVDTCPVDCVYRTHIGRCGFSELTDEDVDAKTIAELKGKKSYKVKAHISSSKSSIAIGLVVDKYSSYLRESFPTSGKVHSVNTNDSKISDILWKYFRLTDIQQKEFWSEDRFNNWSSRNSVTTSLSEIKQALLSI